MSGPGGGTGGPAGGHGLSGVADAAAFLTRLTRLDPAAVVRLRSAGGCGRTALWARLPWAVLVSRTVSGVGPGDVTVSAADLLARIDRDDPGLPGRRDSDWRWPLPATPGRVVETMSGEDVRRVATAAAGALRSVSAQGVAGRAVGWRALRDALLDHVAVVVTGPPVVGWSDAVETLPAVGRIEVSQRLVQGVVRMGFLGGDSVDDHVQVRLAGQWIALSAPYGVAWSQNVNQLAIRPM